MRALTTPESKGIAFDSLFKLFCQTLEGDSEMKWLLGSAIAEAATETDIETIIELSENEKHGLGREFLPLGLVGCAKADALPTLERWTNDEVLKECSHKAIKLFH